MHRNNRYNNILA